MDRPQTISGGIALNSDGELTALLDSDKKDMANTERAPAAESETALLNCKEFDTIKKQLELYVSTGGAVGASQNPSTIQLLANATAGAQSV